MQRDLKSMVLKMDKDHGKPETVYMFSNGRTFQESEYPTLYRFGDETDIRFGDEEIAWG